MKAREGIMRSREYDEDIYKLYPVVENEMTDSGWKFLQINLTIRNFKGSFDNVLEFLVYAGKRSLPEAAMTMVPEAWEKDEEMKFYFFYNYFSKIVMKNESFIDGQQCKWSLGMGQLFWHLVMDVISEQFSIGMV